MMVSVFVFPEQYKDNGKFKGKCCTIHISIEENSNTHTHTIMECQSLTHVSQFSEICE